MNLVNKGIWKSKNPQLLWAIGSQKLWNFAPIFSIKMPKTPGMTAF